MRPQFGELKDRKMRYSPIANITAVCGQLLPEGNPPSEGD
jgi:hypothetical protein